MQRQNKDHQKVVVQQPDPEKNVTETSDIWLIPGEYETVHHIITLNK